MKHFLLLLLIHVSLLSNSQSITINGSIKHCSNSKIHFDISRNPLTERSDDSIITIDTSGNFTFVFESNSPREINFRIGQNAGQFFAFPNTRISINADLNEFAKSLRISGSLQNLTKAGHLLFTDFKPDSSYFNKHNQNWDKLYNEINLFTNKKIGLLKTFADSLHLTEDEQNYAYSEIKYSLYDKFRHYLEIQKIPLEDKKYSFFDSFNLSDNESSFLSEKYNSCVEWAVLRKYLLETKSTFSSIIADSSFFFGQYSCGKKMLSGMVLDVFLTRMTSRILDRDIKGSYRAYVMHSNDCKSNILKGIIEEIFLSNGQTKREVKLTGKTTMTPEGVIYFINVTNKKTDSAAIKEHSFTYEPITDSPHTSTIYVKSQNTFWGPFSLLIHKQQISVRIDSNSITSLNKNDSINKIYLLFREKHFEFIDSIGKLSSADDAEMKNNYPKRQLLFETYIHDFFEKAYTYRNNLGTAAALCEFVIKDRLLNVDSVAVLYNILSETNRASHFGIQALQHITKSTALLPGRKAPNFSIPDLNDKIHALEDYRGKYVLLNFWASWCGPCRNENAELSKYFATPYNAGLSIINISLDSNREKMEAALKADSLNKFINCIVLEGFNSKIARSYYLTGIPASYLISKTGAIIGVNLSIEEIRNRIK